MRQYSKTIKIYKNFSLNNSKPIRKINRLKNKKIITLEKNSFKYKEYQQPRIYNNKILKKIK